MLCGIWFGVLLSLLALSSLHAEDDIGRGKKYWRKLRKPSRGQTSPPHVANKASQPSIIKEEENVDQIRQKDFPLFIVAGTQKSGTTALAAYLSLHPNITMSKKKELHFFDKNNNYQQGMVHYLEEFIHTENTMMYGEATPFYLASRQACARIAKHLPDAKLIILLREPVQRAYSEYQMKKRRVEEQEHFQRWMEYTALTTLQCLWQHPHNYQLILNCLPSSIRQHSRISKFTKALKKSMTKWSNWEDVVESCFPMDAVQAKQLAARHQQLNLHFAFNRSTYYYHQKVHHGQDIFDMQSCWQNYKEGYEAVSSLEKALQQEVQDFQRCSLPLQTTQILSLNKSTEMLSDEEQLELLDQQIEKCIKVKSGISSQYFYRSLYVAQLHHCFKVCILSI